MKTKIKRVIPFFIFFMLMITSIIGFDDNFNTVKGSYAVICNFDDVPASGLSNFTSGLFEVETLHNWSRAHTTTDGDYSSPFAFEFEVDDDEQPMTYLNFTTNYDYINKINFTFQWASCNGNEIEMIFYDGSDECLKLKFGHPTSNVMYFYDVTNGWTQIGVINAGRYFINITHNMSNYMRYELTGGVTATVEGASAEAQTWDTFTHIRLWSVEGQTCTNAGCTARLRFDDFRIDTKRTYGTGVTNIICFDCCDDQQKGTVVSYDLTVLGDNESTAYIQFYDPNNTLYFARLLNYGSNSFDVFFVNTAEEGTWTVNLFDSSELFTDQGGYEDSCTFTLYNHTGEIENYTAYYGEFFAEWVSTSECYFNVGADPEIVYYMNGSYLASSDERFFIRVINADTNETFAGMWVSPNDYNTTMTFSYKQSGGFPEGGSYYLVVYNATFSGFVWTVQDVLYTSSTIGVCEEEYNANTYTIELDPVYDVYAYTDTVEITFTKTGDFSPATYTIQNPLGEVVVRDQIDLDGSTAFESITFSDEGENWRIRGEWKATIYDKGGKIYDFNAVRVYFEVGVSREDTFLPTLGDTFAFILGVCVTAFFTLIPLVFQASILNKMKGQVELKIPYPVYTAFTCLGMLISWRLNLFDYWVFFFVLAMGLITLAVVYLTVKSKIEGG